MSLYFRSVATSILPNLSAVESSRAALNELAQANALSRTAITRLQIVLDELVSNIIRHGYPSNQQGAGVIYVMMSIGDGKFQMRLCDAAQRFDPTKPHYDEGAVRPAVGGRGLDMVHALVDETTHQWIDNTNVTIVTKKINNTINGDSMTPGLTIDEERGDGTVIVKLQGRIDSGNASQLTEHLKALAQGGFADITLELEKLEYLTSAGFRTLLVTTDAAEEAGGSLSLCNLSEEVRDLFDLSGLSSAFRMK